MNGKIGMLCVSTKLKEGTWTNGYRQKFVKTADGWRSRRWSENITAGFTLHFGDERRSTVSRFSVIEHLVMPWHEEWPLPRSYLFTALVPLCSSIFEKHLHITFNSTQPASESILHLNPGLCWFLWWGNCVLKSLGVAKTDVLSVSLSLFLLCFTRSLYRLLEELGKVNRL